MGSDMTIRFTLAEKWQDLWFRKLNPAEKLLFLYICDNCNIAGIWEIDIEQAAFSTGVHIEKIKGAYKGLARGYETLDENYIWVKNFLKHQRNLPLNPNNAAHATIVNLLLPYKGCSDNILQLLSTDDIKGLTRGLQSPLSISIGKGKGKSVSKGKKVFIPPALEELQKYINEKDYQVDAKKFLEWYTEAGWKDRDGKPVKNWKLKVISWSGRNEQQTTHSNTGKPTQRAFAASKTDKPDDSEPFYR